MLKVIKFKQKDKQPEQPQANETIKSMLLELYNLASTGELRSFAVAGTTSGRDVVMSYCTDPANPDVFRLVGLLDACKLRMLDEGVDYDAPEGG
jgi:hypothetical protein